MPTLKEDGIMLLPCVDLGAKCPAVRELVACQAAAAHLRKVLVDFIGGMESAKELDELEMYVRISPAPDKDKAATINAIDAIRETTKYKE